MFSCHSSLPCGIICCYSFEAISVTECCHRIASGVFTIGPLGPWCPPLNCGKNNAYGKKCNQNAPFARKNLKNFNLKGEGLAPLSEILNTPLRIAACNNVCACVW